MQEKNLAPWEVPPDESYWQALLREEPALENGSPVPEFKPLDLATEAALPAQPPPAAAPSPPDLADSPVDVADSPVDVADSPVDVADSPVDVADSLVDVADSLADVAEALASFTAPPDRPEPDRAPEDEALDFVPENPDSWNLFCEHRDAGNTVELTVESYNRGGLLVRWEEIVGFVPASQLCDGLRYGDEEARLKDLSTRVGSSLTLKVIEVDPAKNRLILSERAARHVADPDLDVLDELSPGDICRGLVTNLCTFGAFIDLGGVEGLIHISELSWGRVSHPADILQSGEQVEVYVLNVDRGQGRVGLSLKRLQPDPWNSVGERYQVGQVIEGEITNIVNFGAFVRIEEGLEGLIHTSELNGALASSLYTLREGTRVLVRINSIEGDRHRIGLSLE